jgi:hypothetical protein
MGREKKYGAAQDTPSKIFCGALAKLSWLCARKFRGLHRGFAVRIFGKKL